MMLRFLPLALGLGLSVAARAEMAIPCEAQINQILRLHGKPVLEKGDYEFHRARAKYSYQGLKSQSPLFKNEGMVTALADLGREKELLEKHPDLQKDDLLQRSVQRSEYFEQKVMQIECESKKNCDDQKLAAIQKKLTAYSAAINESGKKSSEVRVRYDNVMFGINDLLRKNVFDLSIESKVEGDPGKELASRYVLERKLREAKEKMDNYELLPKSLPPEGQRTAQEKKQARAWAEELRKAQAKLADFQSRLEQTPPPRAVESTKIVFSKDGEIQLFKYQKQWEEQRMGKIDLATCKFKTPVGRIGEGLSSLYNCKGGTPKEELELCQKAQKLEKELPPATGKTAPPVS